MRGTRQKERLGRGRGNDRGPGEKVRGRRDRMIIKEWRILANWEKRYGEWRNVTGMEREEKGFRKGWSWLLEGEETPSDDRKGAEWNGGKRKKRNRNVKKGIGTKVKG